jgi:hypothetical protein
MALRCISIKFTASRAIPGDGPACLKLHGNAIPQIKTVPWVMVKFYKKSPEIAGFCRYLGYKFAGYRQQEKKAKIYTLPNQERKSKRN